MRSIPTDDDMMDVLWKMRVHVFFAVQLILLAVFSVFLTAAVHRVNGLLQLVKVLTDQVGS